MCKYCENIVEYPESFPSIALYEPVEGEYEVKFRIGCSRGGGGGNYWFFGAEGSVDVEIKYCPFCGQKLEE